MKMPMRMPSLPLHRGMKSIISRPRKCAGAADATGAGAAVTGVGAAAAIGAGVAAAGTGVIGAGTGAAAGIVAAIGAVVTIRAGLRAGFPALIVFGPTGQASDPHLPN